MGNMFDIKGPTFQRLISNFTEKIHYFCVRTFVSESAEKIDMDYYLEPKCLFKNFTLVLEAVDVTFQQTIRPSGKIQ